MDGWMDGWMERRKAFLTHENFRVLRDPRKNHIFQTFFPATFTFDLFIPLLLVYFFFYYCNPYSLNVIQSINKESTRKSDLLLRRWFTVRR